MAAAYPKPDAERRTRVPQVFGWTDLPALSGINPPALPSLRDWSSETLRWWAELWSKGQATQWDRSGSTAVPMAVLYQDLQDKPDKAAGLLAELRQHEDRHGLNPKAMLQLRWRFVVDVAEGAAPAPTVRRKSDRRDRVLQLIPDAAS